MDEHRLRDALEACLSEADFPPERQQAVFNAVRKDENRVKRKISAALVFVIVLLLAAGGAAIAAGLGVFGQAVNDAMNEQSATRLENLEEAAAIIDDTQEAQAPDRSDTSARTQTVREEMLANLYGRRFSLTLNQSYCDGNKLSYSYTLTTNTPLIWYEGEGEPTGFDSWDMQEAGSYADYYTQYREEDQLRHIAFFEEHPVGYIGRETMGIGDGADLDGEPLTILESGETMIDEYTIQGFQEVEMPEGFTPDGDIEIELSILYGASLYYQDEENVYWAHVAVPENRGFLRLSFTVPLNGQTETYIGTVTTSAYSARATVRISDVDISGEVVFDAPGGAASFESRESPAMREESSVMPADIYDYTLLAGGVEYPNLDGAFGVNEEGKWAIQIRYDLPQHTKGMVLRPNGSGLARADGEREKEDILLHRERETGA